jgi:small-conductance mechanosensitive channel
MRSLAAKDLRTRARRARRELAVLAPLVAAVLVLYAHRVALFGIDTPVRIVAGAVLVVLGWTSARALGRLLAPALARRSIDTAGPAGFVIRFLTVGLALITALRVVGLDPTTVAAGGAVTAVVIGLAAQQTLGNLLAGVVLLSARPFRVGNRVRFHSGSMAGQIEGVVAGLGLLYTTLVDRGDQIHVPNSVVLNAAVVPLREPASVDLRAQLAARLTPIDLQELLDNGIDTPLRGTPDIDIEEIAPDGIIVRVTATPADDGDGPRLAGEVVSLLGDSSIVRPATDPSRRADDG